MNRLMVSLGILVLLGICSYAQSPTQESSQQESKAAANSSTSSGSTSPSQSEMQKATSDDGFDKPPGRHHVRLGGISVSAGYARFSGFYPYAYPYAFPYEPFYYPFSAMVGDPFWGYYPPFYPSGYFGPGNGKGELKLTGAPKDASVYINGGYAGTIEHLKNFWLDPGAYDLTVTTADGRRFEQRVYMLTGKTLKLEAKMEKPKEGENL